MHIIGESFSIDDFLHSTYFQNTAKSISVVIFRSVESVAANRVCPSCAETVAVPTTCSRTSIEMVALVYLLLCRLLVEGQIWHSAPLRPFNDHLRILFLI